jgi:S-adenosylmethionine hydrolase
VAAPLITLTTDFGETSYYVGALRGVLYRLCPEARLVDITHQIASFSPLEASFVLSQACPEFPPGTIHLAVVDPGVGGLRRPLIIRTERFAFVGPDNGIFTPFLDGTERVYRIRTEGEESPTFHGRDVFAPAAARLALGEPPETIGEPTSGAVRLHLPRPRREGHSLLGQVLMLDRFGNLITNVHRRDIEFLGPSILVHMGTERVRGLARSYHEGIVGEPLALIGSSGHLELAVVQGSASAQLGMGRGARVRVTSLEST